MYVVELKVLYNHTNKNKKSYAGGYKSIAINLENAIISRTTCDIIIEKYRLIYYYKNITTLKLFDNII